MIGSRIGTGGLSLPARADAVARSWRTRVRSNGSDVSNATFNIVETFVSTLKANPSLWSKVNNGTARLSLVCGDDLNAALVPILVGAGPALDTGNNLVGGDYSESVGISGNAVNKTVDTIAIDDVGHTTADACVLMASTKEAVHADFAAFWSDEVSKEEAFCWDSAEVKGLVHAGSLVLCDMQPDTRTGLWGISCVSNALNQFRNGARRKVYNTTTFAATSVSGVYRFLGRQGGSLESGGALGGYFIGPGLTNSEMYDLSEAMATALAALGRPLQKTGEKTPLRAYGDSMTNGDGSTGGTNGWVKQYYNDDPLRMCFNGGVSGIISADLKNNVFLPERAIADDIVVIMVGTNDYHFSELAAQNALGHIQDMVAAVVATGNTKWAVCAPCGSYVHILGSDEHTWLKIICDGLETAYPNNFIDVRQAVIDANDGSPTDLADVANDVTPTSLRAPADSVHLNDAGYTAMKNAIKAFIDGKGW